VEKITGRLIGGIEFQGETHRDFTLRPLLVRDSLGILEEAKDMPAVHVELAFLSRRMTLGTIPKEALTAELLLDNMHDEDLDIVMKAKDDLQKKILAAAEAAGPSAVSAS